MKDSKPIGKYKVGLPGSEAYKAKTPPKIRMIGEIFLFAGFAISVIAVPVGLPAWVIAAGSISGYLGKKLAKMFGE